MWAGFWLGAVAYPVTWIWGGRLERFGATVWLVHTVIMIVTFILTRAAGVSYLPATIANCVCLLIFGWLCFRSDRWWPFLMTVVLGLAGLVDVVGLLSPVISPWGAASAKIGLGYLIDLTLLLGVGERWLAGEEPAGRAAWARAHAATAARRNRKREARRSAAMPHEPAKAGVS